MYFCLFIFLKYLVNTFYIDVHTQGFVPLVSENRTKYTCIHCPYTTADVCHMRYHQVKHTGARPFKCNICQKNFSQKSSLGRHVKQIHKISPLC